MRQSTPSLQCWSQLAPGPRTQIGLEVNESDAPQAARSGLCLEYSSSPLPRMMVQQRCLRGHSGGDRHELPLSLLQP